MNLLTPINAEHARYLLEEQRKFGDIPSDQLEWLYETTNATRYMSTVPQLCKILIDRGIAYEITERISS